MVKHKPVSFATVVALLTLVTLVIKLIHILVKWNNTNKIKIMSFCCYAVKVKLLKRLFRPGYQG